MKRILAGFLLIAAAACHQAVRNTPPAPVTPKDSTSSPEAHDSARAPYVEPPDTTPPQALTLAKRRPGPPLDTIMDIDVMDVSLEGSEVKAHYIRDTLRDATWDIFGETFQDHLRFTFMGNGMAQVTDRFERYKKSMGDVKSDKDVIKDNSFFLIDSTGNILTGIKLSKRFKEERQDIIEEFTIFKKNVPLLLHE